MAVRKNLSQMGIAHLISFLLSFGSVVVVSRLLTPLEIGVYSVSVAVLGMAHIFRDFGVGQYLVQAREVGRKEFRAAFSVTLYSSWLLAFVLFMAREPLARLYDHPGVAEVLSILCINFLILPFGTPLLALMQRELQFHYLATNLWLTNLVQTVVTIGCAFAGQSYLSMAWGALVAHVVKVVWLNCVRPGEIIMWPTVRGIGEAFRFGSLASLASIIRELGSGAPDLILGRTLGFVEVAFLSRANGLKKMLIARVIALVRSVYFPTFASELRSGVNGAELFSRSMCYLVAIMAPILAVMAVLAEPLILFLFGSQWERSAPLASLICVYAMVLTPYTFYSLSLIAAGEVKRNLAVESVIQAVQVLVLLSSIWLSLEDVVRLFGLVTMAQILCVQRALYRTFGLRFVDHMRTVFPSLMLVPCSCLGPALAVFYAMSNGLSGYHFPILAVSGLLAGVGWLTGVFVLRHPMKMEVLTLIGTLNRICFSRFRQNAK
ncbi:oligosaccharide flippase family protein [Marinobacterium aestuariivivens]|uniref:Oligosaccharide flippase family protein n=1 Tax=Marinobacterium aestuariivivens TaxID=1698799 RepID=A0ABW1ZUP5_9GAMM